MADAPKVDPRIISGKVEKESFLTREVRPMLETLAVQYYTTTPPPEDIVGFLIDTLVHQRGLPQPAEGALKDYEVDEVENLKNKVKELQASVAEARRRAGPRGAKPLA
mmetsp:Transcript_47622/g.101949  ORF Transcript_47622/g.101949 Transcript_47622/m.101949 type:complete len:108 (+) Transcript_47622:171-494(+)